ncbi:MAG: DUF3352 domain-containing protein [Aureispira sp.]|nr:DUF3352 domain-containing protein [Aureispira sp.]
MDWSKTLQKSSNPRMDIKTKISNFYTQQVQPKLRLHQKKIIIGSLVTILLLWIGSSWGLFRLPFSSVQALEAIPENTSIILELTDYEHTSSKIQETEYFNAFQNAHIVGKWINGLAQLDSIFTTTNSYPELLKQAHIVSGLQLTSADDFNWLFVLDNYEYGFSLNSFLEELPTNQISKTNYRGQSIYSTRFKNSQDFAFAYYGGLILASPSTLLVEAGIEQLDNIRSNVLRNKNFLKIDDLASDNSDLTIYFNFEALPLLATTVTPPNPKDINSLSQVAEWSGLDARFQSNNFVLSGHTYPKTTAPYWTALAKQASCPKSTIGKVLPDNIASLAYIGVADFQAFYEQSKSEDYKAVDFEEYVLPWIADEVAYFITEPTSKDFHADKFVAIKSKNAELSQVVLEQYADKFGELGSYKYQNYTIKQIAASDFMQPLFGEIFNPIQNPFYIVVDEYVIFCNSLAVLQLWIEKYNFEKTLANVKAYQTFLNQLQDNSQLYIYINPQKAGQLYKSYLRPELKDYIDPYYNEFRNISPIGIQFTAFQGHFLTTISAAYQGNSNISKINVAWRCELKANASISPKATLNKKTKQYEIFTQDTDHNIYLINRSGDLLWEKTLPSKIVSPIYEVDFYNNGITQLAFSTKTAIYIITREGNILKEIQLIAPSPSGVFVADYGMGPRLFAPCNNGNIYGFDKNGKPLAGWNPQEQGGLVDFPMHYFSSNGKDYITMMSKKGQLHVFKRNGKKHFNTVNFKTSISDFNYDASIGRIAAGASNGKIYIANLKGKSFSLRAEPEMTKNAQFAYADVIGDSRKDYIRLSQNLLTTHFYDSTGKPQRAFLHKFDQVQDDVFQVPLPHEKFDCIGTYSQKLQSIYLFNGKGQIQPGFPLVGTSKFEVVDLFDEHTNTLLVANNNIIYAYKLAF